MLRITPNIAIDEAELQERFVRSSGPGGQNVNKVSTAVELRFDAAGSPAIDARMLERLRSLAGSRMTADGLLVIDAREHRTQARNREEARARLVELLRSAAAPPKRRRRTKPTAASRVRRVESKKHRSRAKEARGTVPRED